MSNENRDPGATPSGRRPPTIDLTAKEVASKEPAGETEAGAKPEQEKAPSAQPRAGNGAGARRFLMAAAGAAFGACAAFALGAVLWNAGVLTGQASDSELGARLARIEGRLRDDPRPAPASDPKMLGDIAARLAKIETTLATPSSTDSAFAGRVNEAEAAAKAASNDVASLRGRIDEITSLVRDAQRRADAAANAADAAQKSSQSTTAELARAAQPDDHASRLAVAASALRAAVERGEPFATELATVKSLASNQANLAPLESSAATGVVSASALARDLTALVPALIKAISSEQPNATFLEKLQAHAERVVRVRPAGDVAGDDPASVIARIESKARQSDIDGALAEFAALPAPIRAPADDWIKAAEQRKAALAASRQFARDALATLGKPSL